MQQLTWRQVNAWRLAQQRLLERAAPEELRAVVARLGGVQAQLKCNKAKQQKGVFLCHYRPQVTGQVQPKRSMLST
ncbi:MAG: hypothetical protein R3E79_14065 [Caldilineaceae bacterium]